ncbi:hypothetical protein RRG08_025855 [Elysia crispata]|uniref:Uncharacterized protein n=1 Tax=Elysia crispata TaxID=231223 RepID=A0AAE0Y3B0_9GAST|nr:hypothetical protein RRG08_025855 [Elysia crispata]
MVGAFHDNKKSYQTFIKPYLFSGYKDELQVVGAFHDKKKSYQTFIKPYLFFGYKDELQVVGAFHDIKKSYQTCMSQKLQLDTAEIKIMSRDVRTPLDHQSRKQNRIVVECSLVFALFIGTFRVL